MGNSTKRKIFIINAEFQFKFSLIVCSILFIASLIYPYFIYEFIELVAKQVTQASELSELQNINFEELGTSVASLLIIIQIGFIALTFVVCIFVSHKIAGPMYKLCNYLEDIRNGGLSQELYFRDGDYFQEVAAELNETLDYLESRDEDEIEYLTEVSAYMENIALVVPDDKRPVLQEIINKIEDFKRLNNTV